MDPRTQSQYDVRRAAFAGGGSGGNDEMMTEGEGGSGGNDERMTEGGEGGSKP